MAICADIDGTPSFQSPARGETQNSSTPAKDRRRIRLCVSDPGLNCHTSIHGQGRHPTACVWAAEDGHAGRKSRARFFAASGLGGEKKGTRVGRDDPRGVKWWDEVARDWSPRFFRTKSQKHANLVLPTISRDLGGGAKFVPNSTEFFVAHFDEGDRGI